MDNENKDFLTVFARLNQLGIKTQAQLSEKLGITQSAVADAKKRGFFPQGWAIKLSRTYTRPVEWILTGQPLELGNKTENPGRGIGYKNNAYMGNRGEYNKSNSADQKMVDEIFPLLYNPGKYNNEDGGGEMLKTIIALQKLVIDLQAENLSLVKEKLARENELKKAGRGDGP